MALQASPPLGVIEAFYGRPWADVARLAVLDELAKLGYRDFVYAPKSDRKLRADWQQAWSTPELERIQRIVRRGQQAGLRVGVGFSPLGLHKIEGPAASALDIKARQLGELGANQLCILFDDMQASGKAMASDQLRIVDFIGQRAMIDAMVVCPSYYTTDPVLEKIFGPRPAAYWRELGSGLDSCAGIFWTGEQVCSKSFTRDNLEYIAGQFRRLPTLWDNYPVNDSEKMCQHLHLLPFAERQHWLRDYIAAHYANPMNQAHLSLLPLATLPAVYEQPGRGGDSQQDRLQAQWLTQLARLPVGLAASLQRDANDFQTLGLDHWSLAKRQQLAAAYAAYDSPVGEDVAAWLRGEFAFDPACLTD